MVISSVIRQLVPWSVTNPNQARSTREWSHQDDTLLGLFVATKRPMIEEIYRGNRGSRGNRGIASRQFRNRIYVSDQRRAVPSSQEVLQILRALESPRELRMTREFQAWVLCPAVAGCFAISCYFAVSPNIRFLFVLRARYSRPARGHIPLYG